MIVILARAALLLLLAALTACSPGGADASGLPGTAAAGRSGFYGAASSGL